jgi:hypothetical protein
LVYGKLSELERRFAAEEWARHPGHAGLLLTTDGIHMTARGNAIIADVMLNAWNITPGKK